MAMMLMPTHKCFDDVGEIWREVLEPLIEKGEDLNQTVRVVHGIKHPPGHDPFAHAWVEHRNDVLEVKLIHHNGELVGKGIARFQKRSYYRAGRIKEFTVYTLREYSLLNVKHGHSGPFENRYYSLVRDPEFRAPPE